MRFYAGQPLRTEDGYHIGTICLIHSSPRPDLSATERASLLDLAGMVLRELEVRRVEVSRIWHELQILMVTSGMNKSAREYKHQCVPNLDPLLWLTVHQIENFSHELETQVLSFRHLIGRLAHHFVSTLALERAFWIDARTTSTNENRRIIPISLHNIVDAVQRM